MFAAKRAELLQLNALGCGLFILRIAVVPILALGALECNDLSWHFRKLPGSLES
jgi:hypothetical protein